ncbi:malonyl-ACP O-methyltransferase BioC [Zhongshania sp. BJYM1]|uniref:malonyl-ACP O-methyltransferase BioC n=1 Tax=Zhongshania aquatica TaxID=2965069 RepID=UPI0022B3F5D6|nr:malonyl-ACP O-methyltransferase BioC [Marortus sp. BJYM1]
MTAIFREYLAAYRGDATELVLLHGWASDSEIWRSVIPALRKHFHITLIDLPGFGRSAGCPSDTSAEEIIEQLLTMLPASAIYCGWSLGGMFATAIAANHPERVVGLITVATNAVFVADEKWLSAMPQHDFSAFQASIEKNATKGLRRFNLLQLHGDKRADNVQAVLSNRNVSTRSCDLLQGLAWLVGIDNRDALHAIVCPVLHVLGAEDVITPSGVAEQLNSAYPNHECAIFSGCGHIPFLSSPSEFISTVVNFATSRCLIKETQSYLLDKGNIGRSFSRAAASYNEAAVVQRRIADRLITLLPSSSSAPLMDLGCGTGYSLGALRQYLGDGEIIAADIAPGMLSYAKNHYVDVACSWLCGDAEDLPLADNSVGQIFSSLALQWCENLPAPYAEIERVLKPGGIAVLATLGPGTLFELREAWRKVDGYSHVNKFPAREEVRSAIQYAGLHIDEWQEDTELMEYERLSDLTRELKSIGAHNVNSGRPSGLTGRKRIQSLTIEYEHFRTHNGLLPASYQVWYLRCRKA